MAGSVVISQHAQERYRQRIDPAGGPRQIRARLKKAVWASRKKLRRIRPRSEDIYARHGDTIFVLCEDEYGDLVVKTCFKWRQ